MAIMQRMMDIQEKRLALDSRQLDINEADMDRNKELALRSMEYNAAANTQHHTAMQRIMGWRYIFWAVIGFFSTIGVITALILGKEAFVVEIVKYLAFFLGGYGAKAVVQSRQKSSQTEEE